MDLIIQISKQSEMIQLTLINLHPNESSQELHCYLLC